MLIIFFTRTQQMAVPKYHHFDLEFISTFWRPILILRSHLGFRYSWFSTIYRFADIKTYNPQVLQSDTATFIISKQIPEIYFNGYTYSFNIYKIKECFILYTKISFLLLEQKYRTIYILNWDVTQIGDTWSCIHRASSYNTYINQQDAQNSCD